MSKLILLMLLSVGLHAEQFNWIYTYKEASAKALKENKPMSKQTVAYLRDPI